LAWEAGTNALKAPSAARAAITARIFMGFLPRNS
jgi:hypothetical protein